MPVANKKPATRGSAAMSSTLRCLRVLELLAEEPFELSLSDLAERLRIPRPSAHRLCATLVEAQLVEQDRRTRRYVLTPKALWIGSGYLRHSAVYRASFFPMQELTKQTPGTAQLGVVDSGQVLFIHSVGSPGSPHAFADVGLRRQFHATASGKVFLAAMPWPEIERIMLSASKKFTEKTITTLDSMKKELARVQRNKYAINVEELLPGYWVIAAPVVAQDGKTIAAISLTLEMAHFNPENEARYAALVRQAAEKSSLQLGHR
jgi:IclR family acetate operon transcriptional repressor